jgi:hypothetical protein
MISGVLLQGTAVFAESPQNIDINVDQDDLLDIVLTLGDSDSDVSNLEDELTDALVTLGVPADKIKIQAVEATEVSAGNTSVGWETYDHTNYSGESTGDLAYYRPYFNETNGNYTLHNHIASTINTTTTIDFYGYGSPAYKDFMYMPNDETGKKTFDFTIQEGTFFDALNGAGFLFNTSMTSNTNLASRTMSGYLMFFDYPYGGTPTAKVFQFANIDVNAFHNSASTTIQSYSGFTQIASFAVGSETTRKVKLEATSETLKMWYNDVLVNWSLTSGGQSTGVPLSTDYGSYGFGPLVGYTSHGCSLLTHFIFRDVNMSTESSAKFSEVIREPEWRDESKRFIINAEDGAVADFSDPVALGEILARLGNENIHYLGWGRDDTDGNAFIVKNGGNGIYVDKDVAATDTHAEQIQALANYIYSVYIDGVNNNTEYLIYGKPSSMSITPETEMTNTADVDWPNGKWRINHDPDFYDNYTGVVPYDNLYLNNLDISFTETGKYDIYYQDELVKTVYVHRRPIASFNVSYDTVYAVTITDSAYDPDFESDLDKGIASVVWSYKKTSDTNWTDGIPTVFVADENYIIMQEVTDGYGVHSDPYMRYVSTTASSTSVPVSEFKVTPSRLLTYIGTTVEYTDTSYDPQGKTITDRLWEITLGSTDIYSGATPQTNFSAAAAGTYKITLSVKNSDNVWSEEVARYLTVVRDTTAPTVVSNTLGGTYSTSKTIGLTFADEEGGSGFSHRYAVVTSSVSTPTEWGSMGTNASYSVRLGNLGANYIHYKTYDYAGNVRSSYVGPFTLVDSTAPTAPTMTTDPSYTNGSWTNATTTVSAAGSTDDFTAAENIVYEVSTDGTTYTPGSSIILSSNGTHTVYFRVSDASNNRTVVSKTVKIDQTAPTTPSITMISDSSTYAEGTWATNSVFVTLSGSTDSGGSTLKEYQYKIDDGEWVTGTEYAFHTSGEYTISYRSVDQAGNTSTTGSKSVLVDVENPGEPTITILPAYTTEWTNQDTTLTALLATDDMTSEEDILYEVSTDGETFTASNTITLTTEGVHTVTFRVTDVGGNTTLVTRTVKLDQTKPTVPSIAMTSDAATYVESTWTKHSVSIVLSSASDEEGGSGLKEYQYKVNDGDWCIGTEYTFDASGIYTICYRSVDGAGNYSDTSSKEIRVDLEAPETFGIVTSATTVDCITISAETTDIQSGLRPLAYRVFNGTTWSDWKATVDETLCGYDRGETVIIKVEAIDVAGNVRLVETEVTTLTNTPPTAVNDDITLAEDAAKKTLDLLGNDIDADIATEGSDVLTIIEISGLSLPAAGKLALQSGIVSFTPALNFFGNASFTYKVTDAYGSTSTATVLLTVEPVNDKPLPTGDIVSMNEDASKTIEIMTNDIDVDSTLKIESFEKPLHGIVVKSGNTLIYTPEKNYNGQDEFAYTVTDGEYSETAQVKITVLAVNDVPLVVPDQEETNYKTAVSIDVLANDSDVESGTLSIISVTTPENGNAVIKDGKISYVPNDGFAGTDSFSYTVSDGDKEATAGVKIKVNDPDVNSEKTVSVLPGSNDGGGDDGDDGDDGEDNDEPKKVEILTQSEKGEVYVVNGKTYYTPNEGATGMDSYTVAVEENGVMVEYQVLTNVDPETGKTTVIGYGIPLKENSFILGVNKTIKIKLSGLVDQDLTGATITINGLPVNGEAKIVNGVLEYTPSKDYLGEDGVSLTIKIGEKELTYCAAFTVVKEAGFISGWCVIGWIVAAILLFLNYLKHKIYYNGKKRNVILYILISAIVLVGLCWLRSVTNYWVSGTLMALYIAGNYLFSDKMQKSIKIKRIHP